MGVVLNGEHVAPRQLSDEELASALNDIKRRQEQREASSTSRRTDAVHRSSSREKSAVPRPVGRTTAVASFLAIRIGQNRR